MLEKHRKQIDEIDKELVRLFEQRMMLISQIGQIKKANHMPIFDEGRERIVIEKARMLLNHKEYEEAICQLFINLMKISKDVQHEKNR